MNDWAEEGGTQEKTIAEAEKLAEERRKEIEALKASTKRHKQDMQSMLAWGIGCLGILAIVAGAITKPLLPVALGFGSFLFLVSVLSTIWIWLH